MNQRERILKYIDDFGSISPLDAFMDIGVTKLSTRISELRRDGYSILGEWEESRNRYGAKCRYMRYRNGNR